ncbi:hypothetical protein KIH87_11435 [Paraneptunicella aestuarii]|uniref:ligand-binding sensor domain-containing protein n=1 Tax=Paraneptunicella aestuarii TaxID=2831148 RepID=UPI001E4A4507|nr:sensor histidine kinase [Paraneptunicella aestuarii]UAA37336.1 hypothetical protein KIH87_11435 [Paraneptunicella aestuarii]
MNLFSLQRLTTLFILILISINSHAAFFSSVKRYSIEDGLPATTIYTLLKDQSGYFWLGTPKGLVRYDGYDFEVYSSNNKNNLKLVLPDAGNIFIDSKKRIWVGSWGKGLALYNHNLELIKHFQHSSDNPHSISSNMVQLFFEDKQGNIWLGTNGGGLGLFREKTLDFKNFTRKPGEMSSLSHNRVWSVTQSQDGALWVATGNGLNKLLDKDKGIFQQFHHNPEDPESLDHPLVRALLVDKDNNLWVGTETGFGLFDQESGKYQTFSMENRGLDAAITRLRAGGDNVIWVGTQKGLYRFESDNRTFTSLVNESNFALLPHDDIRDIYVDSEQRIWVATRYAGLTRIDLAPSIFEAHNRYSEENGNIHAIQKVYNIFEDKENTVWLGSGSGLLKLTEKGIFKHTLQNLDNSAHVHAIVQDKAGTIWLGTEHGLGTISPDQTTYINRNDLLDGYSNLAVVELMLDRGNNLWIATEHGGLITYNGRTTRSINHDPLDPDSISNNNVTAMYQDNIGRIWIGTAGSGLNRLDPGPNRFFHYEYTPSQIGSLGFGSINSIFQSSDGIMWFGTPLTLDKLIDITDTFENLSTKDGLANSDIKAITEDDFGDLWISTDLGLSQYKRSGHYFINYQQRDGIHGNQFLRRSVLKSKTHGLIFGGENGITRVHTTESSYTSKPPTAQITGVWIDGKKVPQYSFDDESVLELHHTVKNIRIKFSALDFSSIGKNQYSYRIMGFDENWSQPGNDNQIYYSGLDSGEYEFQVKASNNNNDWAETPTSLKITILTPWWQQVWLYVLLAFVLIVSATLLYKIRTRTLAEQKMLLENEISTRTKELFEAQKQLIESEKNASLSGLVAGVAHEINTPVGISVTAASNLIERSQSMLAALESNTLKKSEFIQQINNIHESAEMVLSNLMRASDLIGSFKEVSVDQISQQRRKFAFKDYMEEIIMSLTPQLKTENISMVLQCPDDLVVDSYPGAIAQLITNLTMNSIVHAFDNREGGTIEILIKRMETSPEKIYIRFSDNGKGISHDMIAKIFEPFYTTKRGKGGSGLGLQIISNITNIRLGGTIRCESELGKGTSFHIEILATPP